MIRLYQILFLNQRLFLVATGLICFFVLAFIFPILFILSKFFLFIFLIILFIDVWLLLKNKNGIVARRILPEKLSNGDSNEIAIYIENHYPFSCSLKIIDEIPFQFQFRNACFYTFLQGGETKRINYQLRPLKRGEYLFGELHVYATGIFGLVALQFNFDKDRMVPVYPSYLKMYKYELLAISNYLSAYGIKRIRRIGHSMEFEQIKNYVRGDDYRTVNWKASARRAELMVNHYTDERSQQVYSIIDKGRLMRMPFDGLSLLDYAINTSLVISNIAIKKEDKTGLITFAEKIDTFLNADKKNGQMFRIQEALYRQETLYKESDFQMLYTQVQRRLNQRSLLILYTNFESLQSMNRQKKYLAAIAQHHVLLVVFFENTALKQAKDNIAKSTEEIYIQTVIEKFAFEKKQIVEELKRVGVYSVLTSPSKLTADTINKYLELKALGTI